MANQPKRRGRARRRSTPQLEAARTYRDSRVNFPSTLADNVSLVVLPDRTTNGLNSALWRLIRLTDRFNYSRAAVRAEV